MEIQIVSTVKNDNFIKQYKVLTKIKNLNENWLQHHYSIKLLFCKKKKYKTSQIALIQGGINEIKQTIC